MPLVVVSGGTVTTSAQMPSIISLFVRPSRIYLSDGVTLFDLKHYEYTTQAVSSIDEVRFQMFFMCEGTETVMNLGYLKDSDCGIFDTYLNGQLIFSGWDTYAATQTQYSGYGTLINTPKKGKNLIELRVNGKNALSTAYALKIYGCSLA